MNMDIRKSLRRAILEYANDKVTYESFKDEEDETFGFKAFKNGFEVGEIIAHESIMTYEYELYDVMSEDEYEEIFGDDRVVKLGHLQTQEKFQGIGTELTKKLLYALDKDGVTKYFLNASPMGFDGLSLADLIMFYRKFGFEVYKHQGGNAIMFRLR